MSEDNPGLYERIVTAALERRLDERAHTRALGPSESARRLATHFADHLERVLSSLPAKTRPASQVELVNALLGVIDSHTKSFPLHDDAVSDRLLTAIRADVAPIPPRPQLPLSESGLYVNANRERSLDVALRLECESADRVDLICAFLFWQGYARIRKALRSHLDQGRQLRVLTTTYCASTDARVLDELAELGADIRVSYQSGGTRLHAKAWVFHRNSGFSTAFVGSSNLSASALTSGREWNVRLSQIENRAVLEELSAAFENHWTDEEFVPYDPTEFREVLRAERPRGGLRAVFKLRPRTFQKIILERLAAERQLHDRHRNLVVSATGTGKTVVAALDYAGLCAAVNGVRDSPGSGEIRSSWSSSVSSELDRGSTSARSRLPARVSCLLRPRCGRLASLVASVARGRIPTQRGPPAGATLPFEGSSLGTARATRCRVERLFSERFGRSVLWVHPWK